MPTVPVERIRERIRRITTMAMKHLSSIANDVVWRCAEKLNTSVEELAEEFDVVWKPGSGSYSRKLVEYCSGKALSQEVCFKIEGMIYDGSFSRLTFDMMLAWETPTSADHEFHQEHVAKEKEDKKMRVEGTTEQDDIPLFYSDIMPLLVNNEPNVGEDAFVWLGSLVPIVTDLVNGRFTFETLTAPTGHRLHFPAYDRFLKEIDKCIKHLQKQGKPTGVELADDEFILHVEGTPTSQRVVRHIGATSWPGRLTLTNYALYFEASGIIRYEDALKIELSENVEQNVKAAATGPWGAPLFDKAMVYQSPEIQEEVVLEFPELTSSTRRDHWLALTREIMLMHRFLLKFKVESPIQAWEMHARTILCIIRLHAAREMLRISPPAPTKFLIFSLFDELPKGDYVLEELAENLKKANSGHPCTASSILKCMNTTEAALSSGEEAQEIVKESIKGKADDLSSLESAISQAREEEKEVAVAKATTEGLKEEGISHSTLVLIELLKPLKNLPPLIQEVVMWESPAATLSVISAALIITYKEWVGKAIAAFLFWLITEMIMARKARINEKCNEIVVCTASDSTTMESIISAQYGLQTLHEVVKKANITLLKLWSIFVSKARKHANMVMMGMSAVAIILALIPTKYIIMGLIVYGFSATSKIGNYFGGSQGNRRLKEWWDSIPVVPVRVVDKAE